MALAFDPIEEARGNWERHGWGSVDAMSAATSITRAQQIVLGRVNAVLAPIPLNFSRFEVLRAIHAAIVGWDEMAAWIGRLVGQIPYLPELTGAQVNFCMFFFASPFLWQLRW